MLPPPPGLFSTTAVWLRLACKPDAISRATMSLEPPGVNGTMMRSVLLGNPATGADGCWARAASDQVTEQKAEDPAAAPASSVMNSRRCSGRDVHFMARPPPRSVRAAFPHAAPASGV